MVVFTVLQSVGSPLGAGRGLRNVSWSLNREYPRDMLGLHPSCLGNKQTHPAPALQGAWGVYHLDQVGG